MKNTIQAILESIPMGFLQIDGHGSIISVNSQLEALLGRNHTDLIGQRLQEISPLLPGLLLEEHAHMVMQTLQTRQVEVPFALHEKWLDVHFSPSPEGISIFFQDITAWKRGERTLQQSHEALRIMMETIPQLVWSARPDGQLDAFNHHCFAYFQVGHQELAGENWLRFVHPDDQDRTQETWHTALQTGTIYEMEFRLREGRTGIYQWFLARALPLNDEQGHRLKWFGTATNIDVRKRAELTLQESEMRFRALMASNILGIVVINEQGTILEANEAFLSLVHYSQQECVMRHLSWPLLTVPEDQQHFTQAREQLKMTGYFQPYEQDLLTRQGKRVPVVIGGIIFRWEGSHPLIITFVLDNTARKQLDHQKDLFLGITGHELKTPLAALRGTVQLVQRRLRQTGPSITRVPSEGKRFVQNLNIQLKNALRLIDVQTRLINDLLDVSRITTGTLKLSCEEHDLCDIVSQSVDDLQVIASEHPLLLDLPGSRPVTVWVDHDRIRQVITNFLTNALRYAPLGSPIVIGIDVYHEQARVWVQDQGPGLSHQAQVNIWHRFHQADETLALSHQQKEGRLGLGLYICHMLIAHHQGEVGVQSAPGAGSTFWFSLPIKKGEFANTSPV